MLNDTVSTEAIDPQTPAAPAQDVPAGDPPGGAQPASEPVVSTPPPDNTAGSEPNIPYSRFAEVLRERNELRQRFQQPPAQAPAPQAATAPKEEDYQDYGSFQKAVIAHEVQLGIERYQQVQRQQQQQQTEQQREYNAEVNWSKKASETAASTPDFEQKIASAPKLAPWAVAVMKASPAAGDLAYHLASDHALIERVNSMHPVDAIAEMGRIEAKLAGSKAPPKQSVSKAPPPISPVGSGRTNSAKAFDPGMSQEEYNAAFKPIW